MANVRVYGGEPTRGTREGSPVLPGLLVGIVLIIAWILLARMTHKDVGLASWGVGGLLGIVVGKTAKPATRATGMMAAVLTTCILLIAKVAVVTFALQPALRAAYLKDPDVVSPMVLKEMTQNRSFSPELQRTIDTRPELLRDSTFLGAGYELRTAMMSEADARARTTTAAERERLIRTHLDEALLEKIGFWVLLIMSFGPLDLLWMGLGISTAWKLGQGVI